MHPRIHAAGDPEKSAVVMAATGEGFSFSELERQANRCAHAFRQLGLHTGDKLAIASDNRLPFFAVFWGAQRAGLVLVVLSSRLKAEEIKYILEDSGAKALIVAQPLAETARHVAAITDSLPQLHSILTIGQVDGLACWDDLVDAQPEDPIPDEETGGRMAYSSGTTGRPKGVVYANPGGDPVRPNPSALLFGRLYHLDSNTRYLCPAPLYHSAPMALATSIQSLGGTSVVMEKFDAEAFLKAVERWKISAVMVVPTMFIRLLALPDEVRLRYDLSSLRTVIHAAAPCPAHVKRAMIEWLGPIIEEFYAGSEGNGHTTINSAEWLAHPGSVGRTAVGQIHICDDDGHELPIGQIGTVYFSGGNRVTYHNDSAKTASVHNRLHPDWSTLGDVGYVDEEGYLYLTDRKDYMIISGGVNIYPQEVEDLLSVHPAVADAAVFGVPNADFGEEVKAVIQPCDWTKASPALAEELMVWCRERLADVKCPRSVDFEPALPRGDNGKLYKKELKARYWPA